MNVYAYLIYGMVSISLFCIGTILFYLKYKRNILQKHVQMKAAEIQHQKELLKTIINSQEEERKRIGMDLHDEVGAQLSALRLTIEDFTDMNTDQLSTQQFNGKCKQSIDRIITNVRNISHNLSPIPNGAYELQDAVGDFSDGINHADKIRVIVESEPSLERVVLDYFTKLSLYRIIIELINNTIKHAEAKNIHICFSTDDHHYMINYNDDGIGLPAEYPSLNKGIGLKNIESRLDSIGASYVINSKEKHGFNFLITLSIEQSNGTN